MKALATLAACASCLVFIFGAHQADPGMKHVFYVHGIITYLISLGIIKENHIHEKMLFCLGEAVTCPYKHDGNIAECNVDILLMAAGAYY